MNPKTVHLTNAWHPVSGGVATFYKELLAAAERQHRLMRLVVPAEASRVEDLGSFTRIYHVKAPRAPFNPSYRVLYPHRFLVPGSALHQILSHEQPDLIEVCDKYTLPYLAGLLRLRCVPGVHFRPIVVGLSCERLDANVAAYAESGKLGAAFSRLYMKWLYFPQFDHHIAVSEHTAAELRPAARGHKVDRGVWVAPMGADSERFSPERRSAEGRRMLALRAGVLNGAVLLLYAGRLVPEKNLTLLLETMERLVGRDGRDYRLLIAGTGSSEEEFRSEAERRLPGYVRFLGHIPERDDLAHVYANSDVFVHPNPDEPFGIALLEAMAAGLPLVAPNRGGLTTYANETNARLADPSGDAFAEAISRVIEDDAGRRARCAAARATALEYRWERVTADYLDLYREIHELARGNATSHQRAPKFCSTPGNWLGLETTRRGFILSFLGAAFGAATSACTTSGDCRRYRADVTVTLLGIPVFSRSAVGGAYAVIQERPDGRFKRVAIQLAAGSQPDRAHGVNRFGFIQEIVNEQSDEAEASEYLGLMTASPERSFDQAKQSLGGAATMVPFSAVQGSVRGGRFRNRLLRTMFPASLRWTHCPSLRNEILALFKQPGENGVIVSERPAEEPATFLYTVHRAVLCSASESEGRFLYNGQRYVLCARKQPDVRMGRRFAARALVAMPERTIRLTGLITCLDDKSTSDFKLWFEAGTKPALPIRFEFRGRSFLHLAFEHDPSLAEPATIPLIEQEST